METVKQILSYVLDASLLDLYGLRMLQGFWITIKLVMLSFAAGWLLGWLLVLGRSSSSRLARGFSRGYVYFFRGSPLLAQLFLLYYGMSAFREFWQSIHLWWFFRDPWWCALLAFSLNTAAYQAEIFRGSLMAIPAGQREACRALSLGPIKSFLRVILPQSMRIAIGPLGNEMILLVKASAIASLVTVYDVMGVTKLAYSRSFNFEIYLWAAVLYLLVVEVLRRVLGAAEARLSRHLAR
ncbi:ABC transporter permease [Castellaniella hirudinis]|uniref:ABC transporter permease n=1 Tax=Castellaniella hirudinis TaxID=1144617 RepID=UPI0039C2C08F